MKICNVTFLLFLRGFDSKNKKSHTQTQRYLLGDYSPAVQAAVAASERYASSERYFSDLQVVRERDKHARRVQLLAPSAHQQQTKKAKAKQEQAQAQAKGLCQLVKSQNDLHHFCVVPVMSFTLSGFDSIHMVVLMGLSRCLEVRIHSV
jgi:hypothetical protein